MLAISEPGRASQLTYYYESKLTAIRTGRIDGVVAAIIVVSRATTRVRSIYEQPRMLIL